jgi:hypothetical protein
MKRSMYQRCVYASVSLELMQAKSSTVASEKLAGMIHLMYDRDEEVQVEALRLLRGAT